jgi:hypothetical protein
MHRLRHDVFHPRLQERVDRIFAPDMVAARRDSFGQDLAAHDEHRDRKGGDRGDQERQQQLRVAGELVRAGALS